MIEDSQAKLAQASALEDVEVAVRKSTRWQGARTSRSAASAAAAAAAAAAVVSDRLLGN